MDHQIFFNSDHSQFRADEEDVLAYVQSIIRHANKQEILNWVKELPEQEIQSMIIPFMTEKMSKEIAEKEY
ncbi:DUF6154 family protein [Metabacillus halosaccharovorans]|uniref:DUF6154 family protein n=1 Tax=Metabacillus halosaccharovorans TaxID=930124 RepID=UPI0009950B55|nr:DUF6154 family protein [Metabacillus halosaccharovorans]